MKKINALTGQGFDQPEDSSPDISAIRKRVISGDWSPVNRGEYTLTDLGLRHNGNGLVWLRSGVSVHEADHDEGFSGRDKVSFEYHTPLRPDNSLKENPKTGFVHAQYIDNYCHNIISSSPAWCEFTHRRNGQPLTTFAVQVNPQERKQAASGWYIWRNPHQMDKYTLLNVQRHPGLIGEHERRGWIRENIDYLAGVIRDNAEFSRLMIRLGYVQVRTRKITGKKETFWLYRSSQRELAEDTPLRPRTPASRKASLITVQASESERFAFKRVAVDGRYLWVYADHIRFLKKIRTRVNGKQVQGYSAKNVNLIVEGSDSSSLCKRNTLNKESIFSSVRPVETRYSPDALAEMEKQEILSAAKATLIELNGARGIGTMAHEIMLSHGGRNLASVPVENMAGCLVDLDKLLLLSSSGLVEV